MKLNKTLIFYFYTFPDFLENTAIKMHLYYLNKYSHIFDNAIFIISSKYFDENLLDETKISIIKNLHTNNVTFKTMIDDDFHESGMFKNEVIDKLDALDGLVFVGHTKGVTNFWGINDESIKLWISGLWYYNFEHFDSVVFDLVFNENKSMYGAFLHDCSNEKDSDFNLNNCWYCGNFFWINVGKLKYDLGKKNDDMLTRCYSRFFYEKFPGEMYSIDKLGSFENRSAKPNQINAYLCNIDEVTYVYGDSENFRNQFYEMKNLLII